MSKFFWFPADHVRTALLQAIYSSICPFKRVITSFPMCERCAGQEEEKDKSRSLHARQFVIAVIARFPLRYPRTPIIIAAKLFSNLFSAFALSMGHSQNNSGMPGTKYKMQMMDKMAFPVKYGTN